jgi:teichuronic acid biosynthesis glycosyltransferase TuaG
MNKNELLISVVIPTYNSEEYIADALHSVINQTYTNLEVLLVDDASIDETVAIVSKFISKDSRIFLEKLKVNSGAAIARNTAIKLAKGNCIAFLDADDRWLPNKLELQLKLMQEKNCAVVLSSYYCMNEEGRALGKIITALPSINAKKILKCNYIGNLTGMYSVDKLGKLLAPNIRKRQDWALWISAIQKSGVAYSVSEPLAFYRERENSISSNKLQMLAYNFKIYKDFLKFSYLKSLYFMLLFLYEYFFVKPKNTKYIKHN